MSAPTGEATAELRQLLDALLDRVQPWLSAAAQQAPAEAGCGWCPVCALVAALQGESTELGRRLAEQGAGVLAAVRTLLDEHGDGAHGQGHPAPAAAASPSVQRIPVRRTAGTP